MREKKLVKLIQKALEKYDHLYSNDELIYMKKEMSSLKEMINENKSQSSKGFGN